MRVFSKGLFIICALVATLLLVAGDGAGRGHTDCSSDEVACACDCHDTVALHTLPKLSIPHASAEIVCAEVDVVDVLIPHDIFRPPAA
jgi:hypothetical protein